MPIRLQCSCGKTLAVKDEFAGKTLKCPGCQKGIRVPAAGSGDAKGAGKSSASQQPVVKSAAVSAKGSGARAGGGSPEIGLNDLFAEEGFSQYVGPICPACSQPLKGPEAVMCTHCGVNLQTGEQRIGHKQAMESSGSLGHYQLDEAVRSMASDAELQKRTGNTGMPWWFLTVMLVFIGSFCFALVTIVNAAGADTETTGLAKTFKDWAANSSIVWGCVITGLVIQGIARIWLSILCFKEGLGEGLVVTFLYHKFIGQLFEYPFIALIYTLGFFTTLSGLGLWFVNWLGG